MAKSLLQIEAQASRLENELNGMLKGMGGIVDDALRAKMQRLQARVQHVMRIRARYVANITKQEKAVYDRFAQLRTGDWSRDEQIKASLGVAKAENKPYPREVYMA